MGWLQRHVATIGRHDGPVLLVAPDEFGAPYLIDGLANSGTPLAWTEITVHGGGDPVALGNQLARGLKRSLGDRLFQSALPYQAVIAALTRDLPILAPLWLALSSGDRAPELGVALMKAYGSGLRVLVQFDSMPPGTSAPAGALVLREDDLAVSEDEAAELADGKLALSEVREMLLDCRGAFEPLVLAVSERLGRAPPLRPGPTGPRFPPGTEPEVDAPALLDILMRRGRWVEALELAATALPDRVPSVLRDAGHIYHELGLHGRLWELLERLPQYAPIDETVLFWRLASAFRLGRHAELRQEVRGYLREHDAPDLRALFAGTSLPIAEARIEAKRAFDAAKTPLTAFQHGRLTPGEAGAKLLIEAVDLAEATGRPYEVVRNAGTLVSRLIEAGRYREAASWGRWALSEFDRNALGDGYRRARIVNDWAYARLLIGELAGLEELLENNVAAWLHVSPAIGRLFLSTLGDLLLASGRPAEALRHYRSSWDKADRKRIGFAALTMARALVELGDPGEALRFADEAVDLTRHEPPVLCGPAWAAKAVALAGVVPEEALTCIHEAKRAYQEEPAASRLAQLGLYEARARLLLEGPEAAQESLRNHLDVLAGISPTGLRLLSGPEEWFRELWRMAGEPRPGLEMRFLGRREVWLDDRRVDVSRQEAEILATLALTERPLSLEALLTRLYGDRGTRRALKVAVWRLRQKGLVAKGHPYQLQSPYSADFMRIEQLLLKRDLSTATSLYAGPMLPESESPAVREHDEYLAESLRRTALDARDADMLLRLSELFPEDLELLEAASKAVEAGDPRGALVEARFGRLRSQYAIDDVG